MNNALNEFKVLGCKFIVAGRLVGNEFYSPNELFKRLNENIKDLFIPLGDFRVDISSTELRNKL